MTSAVRAQSVLTDKPVTILVGFTSGGGTDFLARTIAPKLEQRIGRHVKVESHAGANGALVGDALRKAAPEGTLIGCIPSTTVVARLTERALPFDPQADLTPISLAGVYPMTFVAAPKLETSTAPQFIEWLKTAPPDDRRLGVVGSDGYVAFWTRMVSTAFGSEVKGVAYRGARPLLADLRDGKLPAGVASLLSTLESYRSGRARVLLTTANARLAVAPKIQTAFEFGHAALISEEWYGFFTGPGTPQKIVESLNFHLGAVLGDPETVQKLTNAGLVVKSSTPQELAGRVADTLRLYRQKMQGLGLTPAG